MGCAMAQAVSHKSLASCSCRYAAAMVCKSLWPGDCRGRCIS